MAMTELWIPSPNYSSSRGPYNKVVLHTTEGAQTIESLGSFFANPGAGVSSHFGADNKKRGTVGAYVYENHKAWTQGNANDYCLSMELCTPSGAASGWSRSYWLNNQNTLLRNAADWVAWMCGKYGIPIKALTASEAQNASVKGVCQHRDLGSWGGNHSDCGNGFPMDQVISWAKSGTGGGGTTPAPPAEGILVSSDIAFYKGKQYFAYIDGAGKVCMNGSAVDPGSNARSGVGLAIDPETGLKVITYTNTSGKLCTYQQVDGTTVWTWTDKKWNAK